MVIKKVSLERIHWKRSWEVNNNHSFSRSISIFFFLIMWVVLLIIIYLFIYFWLCWVFVSVRGLSPVAASGGHSSSWCAGLSLSWPLLLWSTGSRRADSAVVAHGPSCSAACGILPDQGSSPRPLHQQADSQPLCHQGSPRSISIFQRYKTKKKKRKKKKKKDIVHYNANFVIWKARTWIVTDSL